MFVGKRSAWEDTATLDLDMDGKGVAESEKGMSINYTLGQMHTSGERGWRGHQGRQLSEAAVSLQARAPAGAGFLTKAKCGSAAEVPRLI